MSEIPAPDPNAPVCVVCRAGGARLIVREVLTTPNSDTVGEGVFFDAGGRKHAHYGTPGGLKYYRCDCGHKWSQEFDATLFSCWCGWGAIT